MLFDSHAHYNDSKFDTCRDELIMKMPQYGVGKIINAGASIDGSFACCELSHKYDFMYFTAGIHPENAAEEIKKYRWLERISELCRDEKCVAVGEIGLDYYWSKEHIEEQKECFRAQLELCRLHKLPAVIHDREAHGDSLAIVKEHPDITGIFHCFSGSVEMLRELIGLGWYISIGGVITFKNARKTVEAIQALGDIPGGKSRLLIETDCPYLAPVPHRGELNHSGFMHYTAEKIAELWNMSPKDVEILTYNNAVKFYNIKD